MTNRRLSLPLALLLAAALSAAPADAQKGHGNGHGNGNGNGKKHEQRDERRDDDRWERDDRRDDDRRVTRRDGSNDNVRWESRSGDNRWSLSRDRRSLSRNGRRVPTGWCQGRGNPHNTAANCGGYRYNTSRSLWDWVGLGSYSTNRTTSGSRTLSSVLGGRTSSGSYDSRHAEFHRQHDARCREAGRNAGSLTRRLAIASQCKDEHDDWHRRTGTRH